MWFTYLFVNKNIYAAHKFAKWSKPLAYIYFEFHEASFFLYIFWERIPNMRTYVLPPYLAVLWTFTCILFGLCVSHLVLWNVFSTKAGFRLFRVLKISNPSVLRDFAFIVHLPSLSRKDDYQNLLQIFLKWLDYHQGWEYIGYSNLNLVSLFLLEISLYFWLRKINCL